MSGNWRELRCAICNNVVAETPSSEWLPDVWCPPCAVNQKRDDAADEETSDDS